MPQDLFQVQENNEVGRYAVASQPLAAGDLIFTETPFVYGPKSDTPPLCLGCLNPVDCTTLCSKCSWPVCSTNCETLPIHANYECAVFAQNAVKFQPVEDCTEPTMQYECITPLRVLLASEKDPDRWLQQVQVMESHDEARKPTPIWQFYQTNVVDFVRGPCKLDRFAPELVHKVCGILDVNAFEARTASGYFIRCLYPKLAILSHNCVSNISHSIEAKGNGACDDFQVSVRATVDVEKGAQLYSSYTYSLWPTLIRRAYLKDSKYFECKCERCKDPTELNTHLGTLKCGKCDNGVIISTDPLSDTCEWKCTHCEFKTTAIAVRKVYDTVQQQIDAVEYTTGPEGIEQRESLYRKFRSIFHPKNAYMTALRSALSQMYGKAEGYTVEDLPDLLLERKVELCNQLLEVLDVVEPGRTRIRGITLYELHAPLMVLARNQYNTDVIDRGEFRKRMEQAVEVLKQAVDILQYESETSPEGQVGKVAKTALDALTANFEVLINTA